MTLLIYNGDLIFIYYQFTSLSLCCPNC